MLISINHPTKQMSGTKERSPGLWGTGGRRRGEERDAREKEGGERRKKQNAGRVAAGIERKGSIGALRAGWFV